MKQKKIFWILCGILCLNLAIGQAAYAAGKRPKQTNPPADFFTAKRSEMVQTQIEDRGIKDRKVIAAMGKIKREIFIPAAVTPFAYSDSPLPIGEGQTISQPYVVAYMTEALALKPEDRVLEIGTGSGYQTAVLAEMAKEVYSIEIIPELASEAKERLAKMGYTNIFIKQGDGYEGWSDHQPFDAIMLTAAPETIPAILLDQLKNPGGRLIAPIGISNQELVLVTRTPSGLKQQKLLPVRFVPMVTWSVSETKSPDTAKGDAETRK